MSFRGLLLLSPLALGLSLPQASSQDSTVEQIQMIRETARDICDTVKSQSGRKSKEQIEYEVKGQVGGLIKRLAGAGVEGAIERGSSDELYEGLPQEALADALEGDQRCRQQVFNKMFDAFFGNDSKTDSTREEDSALQNSMQARSFTLQQGKSTVLIESGKLLVVQLVSGSLAKININGGSSKILGVGQSFDYDFSNQNCKIIVTEIDNRGHSATFFSQCQPVD